MPPGPDELTRRAFEVLVVGSGFGGAVAACRLAQAGLDVAVVERGRRWRPGEFPRDAKRLDDGWLWACHGGLYDVRPTGDMLTVSVAGYGGGSLCYANVAVRPPDEVFASHWPAPYSRRTLDPYYDLVAHMLDVRPVAPDPRTGTLPAKTVLSGQAAERLGSSDASFHPNLAVTFGEPGEVRTNRFGVTQAACTYCGECDIGCNVGAKNTVDLNYLAVAEQHGATVGTRYEALWVGRDGDGYRVRLRDYRSGEREFDVTARHLFVCAGAIGSTELLLRSRDQYRTLPDLPASVGAGYSGNGDVLVFGYDTDVPVQPDHGPTITTALVVDTESIAGRQWILLEEGGYSRHLAQLVRDLDVRQLPPEVARAVSGGALAVLGRAREQGDDLAARTDHTAVMLAMGRDHADGRIELRGSRHRLHVRWDTRAHLPLYAAEQAFAAEVVAGLGGRLVATPTWRMFRQPVSVHNLGGCRMADNATDGVVDPDGQVFGHPGLYVLDGAILPAATGVNPSHSIAAVAERCVEAAIRRITGDPSWTAPERAGATRPDLPEDRAAVAAAQHRPPPVPARGVRFTETMRGTVRLGTGDAFGDTGMRDVSLTLTVDIADLDAFVADPMHLATGSGRILVAGLTAPDGAVVDGATIGILAATAPDGVRTISYVVPFHSADGAAWLLRGVKDARNRVVDAWFATSTLRVGIAPLSERYDTAVLPGTLRLHPMDFLRQMAGMRATGTVDRVGSARTLTRFVAFFAGQLLRAVTLSRRSTGGVRRPQGVR